MKKSDVSRKPVATRPSDRGKGHLRKVSKEDSKYRTLFDQSPDGMVIIDFDGRFIEFNEAAHRQLGFSRKEFAALRVSDINTRENLLALTRRMRKILDGKKVKFEVKHLTKGGEERDVEVITRAITLAGRRVFHTIWRDITERKKAERLLERATVMAIEERNKVEAMISAIGDGVTMRDADFRILFENQLQKEAMGSHKGEYCYRAYRNRDAVCEGCLVAMCYKDGKIHNGVKELRSEKGTVYYEITASPLRDHNGKIIAGIEVVRDITERKRSEESLKSSEAKLNEAQAIAHVGNWEWDVDSGDVRWSDEVFRIYGYKPGEIKPDYDLILNTIRADNKNKFLRAIDDALREDSPFEMDYTFFKKDGSEAVLHTIGKVTRDTRGTPERMYGTVQEITLRKSLEMAMCESENKFKSIFNNVRDGILIAGVLRRRFRAANFSMCRMLGYDNEEILRLRIDDIHPAEHLPRILEDFEKQVKGEKRIAKDVPVLRKDGTIFYADISAAIISLAGERCVIGVFRDITGRKEAEQKMRASLKEKEILLKEIHHRVKNNLQVVSSMLWIQSKYITDEKARLFFQESRQRVESMSLIHETLYRSRELTGIDFRKYVDSLVANVIALNNQLNDVEIILDIGGVFLDINHSIPCGLILNELITNSIRHAFTDGSNGKIVISMHRHEGDGIYMSVTDNGVGLPDTMNFRTTKTIGLQIVMALVKQIDGVIDIDRRGGTSFRIAFPA